MRFNTAFPVECFHHIERLTESTFRQWHFNDVRVVPLVRAAGGLALSAGHEFSPLNVMRGRV
jgi:hypothetical protein